MSVSIGIGNGRELKHSPPPQAHYKLHGSHSCQYSFLQAYAKLHGSYAALRTGRVSEMLVDLTGGVPQRRLRTSLPLPVSSA